MTTENPSITLDLSGMPCPAPLLGAKKVLDDLKPGEVMLLISDCAGTADDLFAWIKYTRHQIRSTCKLGGDKTGYYIQKGKSEQVKPNAVLDIRGVSCPGPIVEAKKLLDAMKSGEVLQLISNCPGAPADVKAWVKTTGLELASMLETAHGTYEFYIRKK